MDRKRLLSIDDDPHVLGLVRGVAIEMGYDVETTTNAGTFMTAYVRYRPNIVTLDICMPDADGIELLRWLDAVGFTERAIILSGAHPDLADMAKRLVGATGHMDIAIVRKPFRIEALRRALSGALTVVGAEQPADPTSLAKPGGTMPVPRD